MRPAKYGLRRRRALAGILAAGALVALGLFAWSLVKPYRIQDDAVSTILAADPQSMVTVEPGLPAHIARAVGVEIAERIVGVGIGFGETPADLKRLEGPLTSLPFLREFDLSGATLADRDIEFIGGLTALRQLGLIDTDITDRALTRLAGLRELDVLYVARSINTTDAGAELIAEQFPDLKVLDLSGTQISDEGMKHISKLSSLEVLSLGKTDVSSDGMTHLVDLPRLRLLRLDRTKVDDSCVPFVQRMAHLRYLDVYETEMTGRGVDRLRKALPKCKVSYTRSEEELTQ
ncbi:MAG: hypothetical protein WD847_13160 [Pirellulales bacterium]